MNITKRILALFISLIAITAVAQSPREMLDRAVAALKSKGAVTATYSVKGTQGKSTGTITMSGVKYRIVSADMKCWYNGSTMWTYSKLTDEVNITTPTAADLQTSNPYAAAADFKTNYDMWKAAGQIAGCYAIMLKPKKKSPVSKLYIYIDLKTNMVRNLHVKMTDGNTFTITLKNYKGGASVNDATFTFDKTMVPQGTQVVDLR